MAEGGVSRQWDEVSIAVIPHCSLVGRDPFSFTVYCYPLRKTRQGVFARRATLSSIGTQEKNQGFSLNRYLGLQFHPEINGEILRTRNYTGKNREKIARDPFRDRANLFAG
jgi:hypothetical protein